MEQLTAISFFILVPSILGFFHYEKDHVIIYLLATLALLSLYFALFPYIHQFQAWFNWHQFFNKLMSVATLTISIILAYRLKNKFLTGMMCTGAALIVLSTFDIIEEIWK